MFEDTVGGDDGTVVWDYNHSITTCSWIIDKTRIIDENDINPYSVDDLVILRNGNI